MTTEPLNPSSQPAASMTNTANMGSIGIILFSVFLGAIGQLTFKAALNDIGELKPGVGMIVDILTSPLLLLGLAIFGSSAFVWLLALMKADLSFAYPFLSLTYIAVLIGGALLFDEKITLVRIIGVTTIIGGLVVISQSERIASKAAEEGQ